MGSRGSGTQVDNGKAFEWAVASSLSELLDVPISDSPEANNCHASFQRISQGLRERFETAASKSAKHIVEKEAAVLSTKPPQRIRIAGDSEGQRGDVRDVIVKCEGGEFGISCKTNHDAFKHSRLSGQNDFVRSWSLSEDGCSDDYWSRVRPLFAELKRIKQDSGGSALWSHQPNVPARFYWPVLDAFEAEILRLTGPDSSAASEVSRRLISYIIGTNDFYKVICRPEHVEIQGFNMNGTLSVPTTKYPDHVLGVDRLNGGQYSKTVRFNRGYTFNFRIHSASSRVEPSLKFDVKAIALPPSEIYTNHISFL